MIEPSRRTILLASLCMRSFESVLGIPIKKNSQTDFKQNCVIGTPPFGKEQLHPMTKDAIYQSNQIVKDQISADFGSPSRRFLPKLREYHLMDRTARRQPLSVDFSMFPFAGENDLHRCHQLRERESSRFLATPQWLLKRFLHVVVSRGGVLV
jgi:hypothetical protein